MGRVYRVVSEISTLEKSCAWTRQKAAKGPKNRPEHTHSEPHKNLSIHFRTNLTSFEHVNDASRL